MRTTLLCTAVLWLLASCDSDTTVLIRLSALPAGTQSLLVTGTAANQSTRIEQTGAPATLAVHVPAGTQGRVRLHVSALAEGCMLAQGRATTILGAGLTELSIKLEAPGLPACPQQQCSADGWCWENPLPQGNHLYRVWGSSDSDVWVVGNGGTVLRWDGAHMGLIHTTTKQPLLGVWGRGAELWIAGGERAVLHGVNQTLASAGSQGDYTIVGIHGGPAATDDVWAVGDGGEIQRWDGSQFVKVQSGVPDSWNLNGIWVSPRGGEAWATASFNDAKGTSGGAVLRLDPGTKAWSTEWTMPGTSQYLTRLWGTASDNIWAFGVEGLFLHRTSVMGMPATWTREFPGITQRYYTLWGSEANDIWAVGPGGNTIHYDGKWTNQASGTGVTLYGVWGQRRDSYWAVGERGTILRWNGSGWIAAHSGPQPHLNGIWGSGESDLWAIGESGVLSFNGLTWEQADGAPAGTLSAIWGQRADDVWAVGPKGMLLHWDDTAWTQVASGTTQDLTAICGDGTNLWVAGAGGLLLRGQGQSFAPVDVGTQENLTGVWADGSHELWVVGDAGGAWRRAEGGAFTRAEGKLSGGFTGIWGSGGKVWLVGRAAQEATQGVILRGDNGTLLLDQSVDQGVPQHVWGQDAQSVWVVGDKGMVKHWNGSAWEVKDSGFSDPLRGIWGQGGALRIVGDNGAILHLKAQP